MNFFYEKLEYLFKAIVVILLISSNCLSLVILKKKNVIPEPITIAQDITEQEIKLTEPLEEKVEEPFFVDIKGAVKNPGVYEVTNKNIVNDVIQLAGGLKTNASTKYLNLSKKLKSEMIIYIYTKTETTKLEKNIQNIKEECHCNTDNINNCITEGSNIIITDQEKENTPETITGVVEKISINTATKEELMTLSGIGEAKATAIINYRNEHGIFNSIEEIKNISGISESIYEKIKDFIKL